MAGVDILRRRSSAISSIPLNALIDDETVAVAKSGDGEKFPAAAIGAHGEAFEFERKLQRIANRRIVIDDGDNRNRRCQFSLRHDAFRGFERDGYQIQY